MATYDSYKDSGMKWLGQIPSHWEVKRAKTIFIRHKRPIRKEDEIVTCFRDGQVTLRKNRRIEGFTNAAKEFGYQGINGGIDISDLLDNTDLNTYALSRTALNEHIELDAAETRLYPLAPKMVNAGDTEEDRTAFDIILRHFNERHMNGWDATPEEQRTKVVRIARLVTQQAQYQNTVVGNPDTEAADRMFRDILNRAMSLQRNADMSLYRQFRADETFRHDFANLVRAAIENVDYLSRQELQIVRESMTGYAAEP